MMVNYAQLDEARRAADALPFRFDFHLTDDAVEVSASGVAAGHDFAVPSPRFSVARGAQAAGQNPLLDLVAELEARLRAIAARFHRATPWPIWTYSKERAMSPKEQVDVALDEYKGMSLVGLSLGPDTWCGFLQETGLKPDELGHVEYRGVPISVGISGIKYVVGS